MVDSADLQPIPVQSEKQPFFAPAFELYVKGKRAPLNVVRDVMEVTYEDGIERIDSFSLTVNNWDAAHRCPIYFGRKEGDPVPDEPDLFEPGNELMLYMGYQGDKRLMMTGVITSVDVQFPETGPSKLVVTGLNILDRLRRKQYTWSWPDDGRKAIRDSDVALAMAAPANDAQNRPGLGIEVRIDEEAAAKEPALQNVFMNNQYPIVFLMELARRRGYEVLMDEEIDENGKPNRFISFGRIQSSRQVTYQLEWGKSLASFHPKYSNAQQVFSVTVCGWDRKAKKRIEVKKNLDQIKGINDDLKAVARAANREEIITEPPARSQREAEDMAEKLLGKNFAATVEATGATVGLPDLRSGRFIEILGTGKIFDGKYRVLTSAHTINDSGYRTTFSARRVEPATKGQKPPGSGT
jgi:phage protein D